MSFQPDSITKEHVLKGVEEMDKAQANWRRTSTKYDVIINGKAYPPKEVMRYAHQAMNGEFLWKYSGGEPTNRFLHQLGFEIEAKGDHENELLQVMGAIGNEHIIRVYYDNLNALFTQHNISENSKQLFCTVRSQYSRIAFSYGRRYVHSIERTSKGFKFGFMLENADAAKYVASENINKTPFNGPRVQLTWVEFTFAQEESGSIDLQTQLEQCNRGLEQEMKVTTKYSYQDRFEGKHNPLIYRMAMDTQYRDEMVAKALYAGSDGVSSVHVVQPKAMDRTKIANNIILYGPPGTGKTYETIDLAVEIVDKDQGSHQANKKRFDDLRQLGQVEFITFHQNYSYEDFVVGLRPVESDGNLVFKKHEGIFYDLCKRAEANYVGSKTGKNIDTFEDAFDTYFKTLIDEGKEKEIHLTREGLSFYVFDVSETTLYFRKKNGNTDHTLSINTLREIYEGTRTSLSGLRSYYLAIMRDLKALPEKQEKRPLKNYVLIVDEINRANISKVFGELITLLEEDKRIGGENELRVTLPNGEKSFGVPPNLYVIGTMNTADKSIAHIDIALRRRFVFRGKYPEASVLSPLFGKVLIGLNNSIKEYKKSADFLIGHGYFIGRPDTDLNGIMNNKVLPLLNEYFIGRTDIIKNVLTSAGLEYVENGMTSTLEVR